jgi:beta-lactam-binding protein with PASTA domain
VAPPTFAPGHDVVGRYRIVELLGVGHVAEVYRAEDLSLRREIALKVLLPHLAAHEDVRRAFRDRIVRSATLGHPHLERVFDGGQEGGHIFVVTEYLPGGSLEERLAAGWRLDIDQTARLGRDVAGALAYLHENGLVHESLSPNSLLFDDEGRVRVTDAPLSGLAGMHGEPLTYDEVRYLSPEQALGEAPGERSDVYALALILYEAVTGESPFEEMTPEAMLRSRATTPLPVRPELGTLDMVLAQAAVPDPAQRLDARQFASRLGAAASDAAPLALARADAEVPLLAQFAPPEPRTSIGFRPPSPDQLSRARSGSEGTRPRAGGARAVFDSQPPRRPPRRRRVWVGVLALVVALGAVAGGVAWRLGYFSLSTTHSVPSLGGLTAAEASAVLSQENYGFTLSITGHHHSSSVAKDHIISQTPAYGAVVKSGQVISVVISDGPVMVTLPALATLVGEDCATATAALAKVHLQAQCPSSAATRSATVPVGRVVRLRAGTTINPKSLPINSTVTLVLSSGPPPTTTTTTGAVTTTTSATGSTTTTTAPKGTTVAVPNLVGMDQAQVAAAMRAARLYYATTGPGSGATPTWTKVVKTVPAAGTIVKVLSSVTVYVTK